MAYLIYNLTYMGKPFDFTTRTKDPKQALFDAVSTVFDEMEVRKRDAGHITRYQLTTNRDHVLMMAILPDIKLDLIETIEGDEEKQLDLCLKIITEFDRIKSDRLISHEMGSGISAHFAQVDFGLRKLIDQRFNNTVVEESVHERIERNDLFQRLIEKACVIIHQVTERQYKEI